MQGYTYQQIMEEVPISKGLLSGWLKYVRLNQEQEQVLFGNIRERSTNGREKAAASNMKRRKEREQKAFENAQNIYNDFKHDPMFVAGVSLYWAEGTKRSSQFGFMNSDPEMILFMLFWVQRYLGVTRENIHIRVNTHADFIGENYEQFWAETTGIPLTQFRKTIYKPNRHGVYKKNPTYKGCVNLEIGGGMELLRVAIALYHILSSEMKVLYSTS